MAPYRDMRRCKKCGGTNIAKDIHEGSYQCCKCGNNWTIEDELRGQ